MVEIGYTYLYDDLPICKSIGAIARPYRANKITVDAIGFGYNIANRITIGHCILVHIDGGATDGDCA